MRPVSIERLCAWLPYAPAGLSPEQRLDWATAKANGSIGNADVQWDHDNYRREQELGGGRVS